MEDINALAIEAVKRLTKQYPDAQCSLEAGEDPWKLMVMGRLSAQCTDARVNIVCKDLFKVFPDARSMAYGDLAQIEALVKPCGLGHSKASNIKEASRIMVEQYDGQLPDTMEELLALPGIGRKIANLLLGDAFHKPAIVTDTHCIRICGRIGLYPETLKDPYKIEKILIPLIPPEESSDFCHRLVQFGRDTCSALRPQCTSCPLQDICHHNKTQG